MDDYYAEKICKWMENINETLQLIAGALLTGGELYPSKLSKGYDRLREHKEYISNLKEEKEGSFV